MTALSWDAVLAWRLERQHLAARAPRDAALDVVSAIAGLHAQVFSSAELTLWARVDELRAGLAGASAVGRARLVKTWAMRGTLHLLRVRRARALRRRARRGCGRATTSPAWLRAHGLDARAGRRDARARSRRRSTATPLTREALAAAVAERVGDEALAEKLGGGFGDLLKPAAFTGDLCFAPSDGRLVRFTRPASLAAGLHAARPGRGGVARRCVRTYLHAYGPAPREQFQRWFGMTSPAEAGRWIARARRRGVRGRRRGRARLDARRRRGGGRGGGAVRRRPAAARLRPLRRRGAARRGGGPRRRAPRRASTARRAGSRRSCWSTAGWPACGRTTPRAAGWRSRWSRSRAVGSRRPRRRRGGGAAARGVPRRRAGRRVGVTLLIRAARAD